MTTTEHSTATEPESAATVTPAAWRTEQAALRLNIPYRTVMRMIHEGRLHAVPAGRYYLVPETAIQQFLGNTQT